MHRLSCSLCSSFVSWLLYRLICLLSNHSSCLYSPSCPLSHSCSYSASARAQLQLPAVQPRQLAVHPLYSLFSLSCIICSLSSLFCSLPSLFCSLSSLFFSLTSLFCSLSSLFCSLTSLSCSLSSLFYSVSSLFCSLSSLFCSLSSLSRLSTMSSLTWTLEICLVSSFPSDIFTEKKSSLLCVVPIPASEFF